MSLLSLMLLVGAFGGHQVEATTTALQDPARLRELILDKQRPGMQSQAALLLVQSNSVDAAEIIRQGLRQTDKPELFQALATALRMQRDARFVDELLTAMATGQPAIRHTAALTLAELTDDRLILRLQALAEDPRIDRGARQSALWTLGQSGRKSAVIVLLDQLSNEDDSLKQAAVDALADLTGRPYGLQVARWREWWEQHKDITNDRWLEERLSFQTSRSRRLENELDRAKSQILSLHQQLYSRLPAADRLGLIQSAADSEDPSIRALAVNWCTELLPSVDAVGQRALADLLFRFSHDGTVEVQRSAILAMGRVQDARVFDRLRSLLSRGETSVRAAAARVLAQQVRGSTPDSIARQRQAVTALQKALEDPALEVVAEAAESLGSLGVPEAGPVLVVLLRHPSPPVRQTAALALERVAEVNVLDGLLESLDDPAVNVRFSLVGAIGHAAGDAKGLSDARRLKLIERLEGILVKDADPGVRSRAATVLGDCGPATVLPTLWRRLLGAEDARVQEKAWSAMIEILVRSNNLDLLQEWDRLLVESKQLQRRLQLLSEIYSRWQKRPELKTAQVVALETLIQAQLEQGKWTVAFPLLRDLLNRPASESEVDRRLRWLLAIGELAVKEGNKSEALRAVQEAQPYIARKANLAELFEKLEKQAKQAQ